MATALAVEPDDEEGEVIEQGGERDYEAEARTMGWVPKDEFRGDPARHVDAKAFVERGENEMPLLKAQLKRVKAELDSVKRDSRKAIAQFSKAQETAYERAMADFELRAAEAAEAGDTAAVTKIMRDARALAPPDKAGATGDPIKEEAEDAWDAFLDSNKWYDRALLPGATDLEKDARIYHDRMTQRNLNKTETMAPSEFFTMIEELVKERFPDLNKPRAKLAASRLSEVAGQSGRRSGRGGKTFDDLPQDAQRLCDKWVKSGLIKDRNAYLSSYDWTGA